MPGRVLAERYRIIALLGRGGMGEVFRADDLSLGQPVALKFLPEAMTDEDTLERFRNEAQAAARDKAATAAIVSLKSAGHCGGVMS